MKQPRTSDFDPNAKQHDLKSSLRDFPLIERAGQGNPAPSEGASDLPVRGVRDVRAAIGGRRKIKSRHPFDIYEDQVEALKQLALEERLRGGAGSMSAMVRDALDDYIAKVRA